MAMIEPAGPRKPEPREEALLAGVREGRRAVRWAVAIAVSLGIVILSASFLLNAGASIASQAFWILQGLIAAGTAIGVKLGARRARRAVRQLPDPEALAALKPLTEDADEHTRRVARELVKGLRPEGSEVVAAPVPEGSGRELAPQDALPAAAPPARRPEADA